MQYDIESTSKFDKWLDSIQDRRNYARILARLERIEKAGHFGDHKQINDQLYELRLFFGKGYRIYYTIKNNTIVVLLGGGDKSGKKAQSMDIKQAMDILDILDMTT